jgi:lipoate-protein ligase A
MMAATEVPAWWDDPADAFTNMAADEVLAAEADRRGGLVVRFYGWSPASVSLGAFQEIAAARELQAIAGLPLVRRPSGGGALVHGSDLTYAAAVPRRHPWGETAQVFYDAVHAALVDELRDRGVAARLHRTSDGPGPADGGFLCFDRRAAGDVVVGEPGGGAAADAPKIVGSKILGSAQRRSAGAILQHGSLLLRANPAAGPAARPLGLLDLHPAACADPRDLAAAWLARIARAAGAAGIWQPRSFRDGRDAEIAAAGGRYRGGRWLDRR